LHHDPNTMAHNFVIVGNQDLRGFHRSSPEASRVLVPGIASQRQAMRVNRLHPSL
jgi:hypothetical protein